MPALQMFFSIGAYIGLKLPLLDRVSHGYIIMLPDKRDDDGGQITLISKPWEESLMERARGWNERLNGYLRPSRLSSLSGMIERRQLAWSAGF